MPKPKPKPKATQAAKSPAKAAAKTSAKTSAKTTPKSQAKSKSKAAARPPAKAAPASASKAGAGKGKAPSAGAQPGGPEAWLAALPAERREPVSRLRKAIADSLPAGFAETLAYGMLAWVVPHDTYPPGYHCDPKQPLPFLSMASQKGFIALYHMGLYADPDLLAWFTDAYARSGAGRLDMGKSCIRFKKPEAIPFGLVAELAGKLSPQQWIALYEKVLKR